MSEWGTRICPRTQYMKADCGCLQCQRERIDEHLYKAINLLDKRMTVLEENTAKNILLLVNSIEMINESLKLLNESN